MRANRLCHIQKGVHLLTLKFGTSNLTLNAVTGSLPDRFDSLLQLNSIFLDQNLLVGEIPISLQNSTSLSTLHIDNNTFDGMLYFPNANHLTQLYASDNSFTYLNLDSNIALQKIILDDNKFNCTLPRADTYSNLEIFSVARNRFMGQPFNLTDTQKLSKL